MEVCVTHTSFERMIKETDAVIDEADDTLGFDDDFFTDDIIEDVE